MISISKPGIILLALATLAGCATNGAGLQQRPEAIEKIDETINDAVASSAEVTRDISEVDITIAGPDPERPVVPPSVVLPAESVQPVTVDWNGPIEPFLEDMAERAGYGFSVTGIAPANPPTIALTANEEPLFGIVRRAGAMANGYAEIAFNPTARVIEIRYRSQT